MSKSKAVVKPVIRDTSRPVVAFSIAQHTLARVDMLKERSGLSRGAIVDLALDALDLCDCCDGTGRDAPGQVTGDGGRCENCAGHGFYPKRLS